MPENKSHGFQDEVMGDDMISYLNVRNLRWNHFRNFARVLSVQNTWIGESEIMPAMLQRQHELERDDT